MQQTKLQTIYTQNQDSHDKKPGVTLALFTPLAKLITRRKLPYLQQYGSEPKKSFIGYSRGMSTAGVATCIGNLPFFLDDN